MLIDEEEGVVKRTGKKDNYKYDEFGEGVSVLDANRLIELTWKERKVHILDRLTLKKLDTFPLWDGLKQGWGVTLDE